MPQCFPQKQALFGERNILEPSFSNPLSEARSHEGVPATPSFITKDTTAAKILAPRDYGHHLKFSLDRARKKWKSMASRLTPQLTVKDPYQMPDVQNSNTPLILQVAIIAYCLVSATEPN